MLDFKKLSVHVRIRIYLPYSCPPLYLKTIIFTKESSCLMSIMLVNKTLSSPMTVHLYYSLCSLAHLWVDQWSSQWILVHAISDMCGLLNKCQLPLEGLSCVSNGKEFACYAGNLCSIPGSGRSPGERIGNPLQYSRLENSMVRVARRAVSPWDCKDWHMAERPAFTLNYFRRVLAAGTILPEGVTFIFVTQARLEGVWDVNVCLHNLGGLFLNGDIAPSTLCGRRRGCVTGPTEEKASYL